MGLEYDFDIVAVAPDEVDPEHAVSAVTGTRPVRAQFRDVKTADALRAASPKIRRIFLESGFSLESQGQKAEAGVYPASEAEDRERILRRLFANIRNMGVQGEYCGEFDFWHFLNHIRTARPGAEPRSTGPATQLPPSSVVPSRAVRRTVPGRLGFAFGLAVVVFVTLKFLAERGAAP